VKAKCNIKVVPIKRSQRIKNVAVKLIVKQEKMIFPCYKDVKGTNGKLAHRKIHVCAMLLYL